MNSCYLCYTTVVLYHCLSELCTPRNKLLTTAGNFRLTVILEYIMYRIEPIHVYLCVCTCAGYMHSIQYVCSAVASVLSYMKAYWSDCSRQYMSFSVIILILLYWGSYSQYWKYAVHSILSSSILEVIDIDCDKCLSVLLEYIYPFQF